MPNRCYTIPDGTKVRVCSAQIAGVWEDPGSTLRKVECFIIHAARCHADIICFPEQFATGWDPESRKNIQQQNGVIISTLQSLARKNSIAILGSFREASPKSPKNTAVVIGKDGNILALYSKMHLFSHSKEDIYFESGDQLGIFSLGPLSCGIAICYDLRFPDLFSIYARKGIQAVFVPAAWPLKRIRHWELLIRARAAENQMYIIGINTTGTTPVDSYSGASMTADPHGDIVQHAGEAEQLIFTDLDSLVVADARQSFPVVRDRKDEIYHKLRDTWSGDHLTNNHGLSR
jgi:omega-amidase